MALVILDSDEKSARKARLSKLWRYLLVPLILLLTPAAVIGIVLLTHTLPVLAGFLGGQLFAFLALAALGFIVALVALRLIAILRDSLAKRPQTSSLTSKPSSQAGPQAKPEPQLTPSLAQQYEEAERITLDQKSTQQEHKAAVARIEALASPPHDYMPAKAILVAYYYQGLERYRQDSDEQMVIVEPNTDTALRWFAQVKPTEETSQSEIDGIFGGNGLNHELLERLRLRLQIKKAEAKLTPTHDPKLLCEIALLCISSLEDEIYEKGIRYLEQAADGNNAIALQKLGEIYIVTAEEKEKAFVYYQRLCDLDDEIPDEVTELLIDHGGIQGRRIALTMYQKMLSEAYINRLLEREAKELNSDANESESFAYRDEYIRVHKELYSKRIQALGKELAEIEGSLVEKKSDEPAEEKEKSAQELLTELKALALKPMPLSSSDTSQLDLLVMQLLDIHENIIKKPSNETSRKEFQTCVEGYEVAGIRLGDSFAISKLGLLYLYGQAGFMDENPEKALGYYQMLCDKFESIPLSIPQRFIEKGIDENEEKKLEKAISMYQAGLSLYQKMMIPGHIEALKERERERERRLLDAKKSRSKIFNEEKYRDQVSHKILEAQARIAFDQAELKWRKSEAVERNQTYFEELKSIIASYSELAKRGASASDKETHSIIHCCYMKKLKLVSESLPAAKRSIEEFEQWEEDQKRMEAQAAAARQRPQLPIPGGPKFGEAPKTRPQPEELNARVFDPEPPLPAVSLLPTAAPTAIPAPESSSSSPSSLEEPSIPKPRD